VSLGGITNLDYTVLLCSKMDWRDGTLFFRDPEDNIIEVYAEY
jgi:hypothetical protein